MMRVEHQVRILLILVTIFKAGGSSVLFARRHSNSVCSLNAVVSTDPVSDSCQFESSIPNSSRLKHFLHFGETACVVVLRNCQPQTCYAIADWTASIPTDNSVCVDRTLPTSIFSNVSFQHASFSWNRGGVQFEPSGDSETVVFSYSTHTCADFYACRGRVEQQLCSTATASVSGVQVAPLGCHSLSQ
eukprot:TRINITY_DN698_c0_g1_i2.p1 TRINITY_DN698_c0_g1~~TRINITY_DN698_c0_g1_i2.p1  ORF type:complete len:188 (-),score=15.13 TRINITY_DN698_c0_g1_i2:109-672(-)